MDRAAVFNAHVTFPCCYFRYISSISFYPDAFYVTYSYDQTGAVTHIRENGATSGAGVLATYAYDNLGRMTSLTRGNGVVTTASFDAASRLTELAHDPAGISWDQTVSFTYNAAGQIASRTMANDIYAFTGYTNIDVNFTVNGLNQYLTANQFTFTHDARGNITSDGMGRTLSY
ncbi:RHS repeat protein, partial [Synechocystis salina LEGE 06155]|nr:RHS repeat protein [Synechocystis salina LEGE 06155]